MFVSRTFVPVQEQYRAGHDPPYGTSGGHCEPFRNLTRAPTWALFSAPVAEVLRPGHPLDLFGRFTTTHACTRPGPELESPGMESVSVKSSPGDSK